MEPRIRIPRIETSVILDSTIAILDGETFRISDKTRDIIRSQKCQTTDSGSSSSYDSIVSVEEEIIDCIESDSESVDVVKEKTFNDYCIEYFRLFEELENVAVRIPLMRIGELKGGIPVVRVENEVFRVCKETKEQIEKDSLLRPVNNKPLKRKRPTVVRNEFNSSSVFLEKRQKIIDRAYFHVISTEMNGDDEICLSGIFVEE